MEQRYTNVTNILFLIIALICFVFLLGCPKENSELAKITYSQDTKEFFTVEEVADNWFILNYSNDKNILAQDLRQIDTQGAVDKIVPITTSGYTTAFLVKIKEE
jgi:hypothetical protein